MILKIPDELIDKLRKKAIIPLKDAMRVTEYKEHDRNFRYYIQRKIKGQSKPFVLRSYTFKIKGTLKHEMYLKPLNPANIKNILGEEFDYKLIMKPNRPIDLDYESKNKRVIELIVYFKK